MRRSLLGIVTSLLALSCGGGDTGGVDPGPAKSIALSLSAGSASVAQGGSTSLVGTITRNGGFTGTVSVSVEGAPAGLASSVTNVTTNGTTTTAQITLNVGAAVVPNSYNLVVRATGSGVSDATAAYTLTVTATATPGYVLSLTPAALTVAQSSSGETTVSLARTAFTGDVTFRIVGAPAGVVGTFTPSTVSGVTTTLSLAVAAIVPVGAYNITVRGAANGLTDRDVVLALTVTAGASVTASASPASLTLAQGASVTSTITVVRTNFTGAINFTNGSNLPSGVTVTFNPVSTTGSTTVMTVSATSVATVGTFSAIPTANGSGIQSVPVIVPTAVTGPSIQLSLTSSGLLVVQNGVPQTTTLNITRTQFAGSVNIAAINVPTGLTVTPNPATTTGNSSIITVSASLAIPSGQYLIPIRVTSSLPEEITNLSVTVQTAAGGNTTATADFSACAADQRPIWVATQNGDFAFQRNVGGGNVYTFEVSNGKGSIAYVLQGAGGATSLIIQSLSQLEWVAPGSRTFCSAAGSRTVAGSITGIAGANIASVGLAGASATALLALPTFTLNNVASGTHDMTVYSRALAGPGATDRMGILRDVTNGTTSVGAFEIGAGGPNAFGVISAAITIAGPINGSEVHTHGMFYLAGASCAVNSLYLGGAVTGNAFTAYGAGLSAPQRASDRHGLFLATANGSSTRTVTEYFHDLTPRTLTLPTLFANTPPGLAGGRPYKSFNVGVTQVPELNSSATLSYTQVGAPKSVTWVATYGWANSTTINMFMPDFTSVAGWDNSWIPAAAAPTTYSVTQSGTNITTNACGLANARLLTSTYSGTN